MTTRADIVRVSREWLGTRYQHQASVKGVGSDCIGLIFGVCAELEVFPADWRMMPEMEEFRAYGRRPHKGTLERGCSKFAIQLPIADAVPGDIALLSFDGEPWHMAVLGDYPHGGLSIIHAYAPMRKVIESRLDPMWLTHIHSTYSLPGVTS
jgi:hypothetical protein